MPLLCLILNNRTDHQATRYSLDVGGAIGTPHNSRKKVDSTRVVNAAYVVVLYPKCDPDYK
eukprot:COSAG01_NODE_72265_length_253_cov_1.006494_1_plen_60_part_10